jgi:hypothetical protein
MMAVFVLVIKGFSEIGMLTLAKKPTKELQLKVRNNESGIKEKNRCFSPFATATIPRWEIIRIVPTTAENRTEQDRTDNNNNNNNSSIPHPSSTIVHSHPPF